MSYELAGPGRDRDVSPKPDAVPGTLPGLMARIESLIKKANAVRDHAENVREKIDGCRAPSEVSAKATVQAVKTGFISQADDMLADLERQLQAADDCLEHLWAKIS